MRITLYTGPEPIHELVVILRSIGMSCIPNATVQERAAEHSVELVPFGDKLWHHRVVKKNEGFWWVVSDLRGGYTWFGRG